MQQKHFISHPDQTRHVWSRIKLLQKGNRERSKTQIVSNTGALRWFSSFSPEVKKAQSSLHWDCISFCRMQSEWKPVPRKPPHVEQNERRQNKWPSLVLCPVGTKTRPKAPAKTHEGWPNCSPKNRSFWLLRNKIRMRSLVPRERKKRE